MQLTNNYSVPGLAHAEYEPLVQQYIAICNRALAANKDKFPFREIWETQWKRFGANNTLRCALYDDRPKLIYDLQLRPNIKIVIMPTASNSSADAWPFRISYLQEVCTHPDVYIEHPLRLNWRWLGQAQD